MKFYIKNMKCARCKLLVKSELEKLDIREINIKAGEVEIKEVFPENKLDKFKAVLHELELELMEDNDTILIENIKAAIHEITYDSSDLLKTNFSEFISQKLGYSYNYLSNRFSAIMGISIKRYFIKQKIERVKEMLIHEDLSLSQIAFQLHFNNVAYLSSQFKRETGSTPSQFRQINHTGRTSTGS